MVQKNYKIERYVQEKIDSAMENENLLDIILTLKFKMTYNVIYCLKSMQFIFKIISIVAVSLIFEKILFILEINSLPAIPLFQYTLEISPFLFIFSALILFEIFKLNYYVLNFKGAFKTLNYDWRMSFDFFKFLLNRTIFTHAFIFLLGSFLKVLCNIMPLSIIFTIIYSIIYIMMYQIYNPSDLFSFWSVLIIALGIQKIYFIQSKEKIQEITSELSKYNNSQSALKKELFIDLIKELNNEYLKSESIDAESHSKIQTNLDILAYSDEEFYTKLNELCYQFIINPEKLKENLENPLKNLIFEMLNALKNRKHEYKFLKETQILFIFNFGIKIRELIIKYLFWYDLDDMIQNVEGNILMSNIDAKKTILEHLKQIGNENLISTLTKPLKEIKKELKQNTAKI
ncbi:hypothetical protein MmarC5_1175 [Methanococcus maripaludis C5]|uniref:Uncharacterized protein n=2 Tax=Methanococcus maripaludis TaxID=39152 RepID=A4FZ39_METM5|nr:hypothetical protein [Methanococcus maripaludis]ABO35473.1 hypothetical protein MmarC5_1175 [Methanococcus maripaludis C5]MBA2860994.1 hypothetical protein [Methanococcus maripaludis]